MSRIGPPLINAWAPLPLDAWLWAPPASPPFPLDREQSRLFAFGRQALWHGVNAFGLEPGDELIMPDYNHGAEVEAIERLGLVPRFHRCDELLQPREDELERLVGARTRALYLIHYNGFPQDAARWRRWCDERGLLLIEDAAQAWLAQRDGSPVGALGDLAFFCAYKTYGLSEGALLISRTPPDALDDDPGRGLSALGRRHGLWLAQRSGGFATLARRLMGSGGYVAELEFDLRELSSLPWSTVGSLLPRLVAQNAADARRANYRLLLRELGADVPQPFAELPPGASPFFFPLRAERKAAMLARLDASGVKALDVWSSTHPSIVALGGSEAQDRRATTIGLPVHQELGLPELARIVDAAGARTTARPALRLEPITAIDDLGAEWDELAEKAGNIFATREWLSTWWRHYGGGRALALTACRDGAGRLVAILPLYVASARPPRTLRFLGHGAGDWLGPICAPEDVERAARALDLLMRGARPRWDALLAEQLPADERWAGLLRGVRLRFEGSPVLALGWKDFDEFLASRSRNFRDQVRRRERKLAREHQLRYRLSEDPATLERDLASLFDLHEARWGDGSDVFDATRRAFHREFAAIALRRGWLRLWVMDLDGEPAAAWYGFRYAGAEWYYQAGRDPAFDREAVGFVLLAHTVRAAIEGGAGEYKLLRGGEEYKGRFASGDPGLETFVVGRGALGAAAAMGATAAAALPDRPRERLSRLAR